MKTFLLILVLPAFILWQGVFASSGELEKKLDRDKFFDRLYQSDYFYFLSGDPDTKLNFSFGFDLSRKYDIDFEYNQTMFWELGQRSKPFSDVNYNPKIVKRFYFNNVFLDLGILEHHSNGRAGIESRSYDSSYIYPKYRYEFDNINIYLGIKLRSFYRLDENNEEIDEFLGHAEFSVATTFFLDSLKKKSLKLNITHSPGGDYDNLFRLGYTKVDIIYDPGWRELPINIHTQFYDGYGESLLGFAEDNRSIRLGVSI